MSTTQKTLAPAIEPAPAERVPAVRRWHRRTALVSSAALAVVITVGGVAHADQGQAAYLKSNPATVADSVEGALVDIVSTNGYQGSVSAGTGMVLTSTGEILTNNHVIDGATSITVTVVATQKTYPAEVVGTDPTDDVAVLQLQNAGGLKTLPIGDSSAVTVGTSVVATGNAGGDGGEPSVVTGTVTALDQDITAGADGAEAEQLTGLIQTSAPVVAGDSGGSLATTAGKVIGMNTAASVSNGTTMTAYGSSPAASVSYAIPIASALTIAHKITTGQASSTIHIGVHGFLGVALAAEDATFGNGFGAGDFGGHGRSGGAGVTVGGIVSSGPAEAAGLQAGDVITAVDGTAIDAAHPLDLVTSQLAPGQTVQLTVLRGGQTVTLSLTLGTRPQTM